MAMAANPKLQIPNYKQFLKPSGLRIVLLVRAALSIIPAPDKVAAIKRIIYFMNFAFLGIVIYHKVADPVKSQSDHRAGKEFAKRLIKNSIVPVVIVAAVGYVQIISTYFIDIYQFMRVWGEGIQCRQFGEQWCNIAVWLGNTWFAYYGEQLSLRVFSLFPDSHSFPQFVLLGLPALFAVSILKLTSNPEKYNILKKFINTRVSMNVVWVPLALLITILSGTRGIWAASVGVIIIILGVIFWMHRTRVKSYYKNIFKYISLYMIAFFMLFAVAYPIFVSPQFLLSKG